MDDLESRLMGINSDVRDSLITQLVNRAYERSASRDNPYYKYQLVESIMDKIDKYAPVDEKFDRNLDSTFNKDETKKIYYGLVCMGHNPKLSIVLTKLTDWEKICFFAGVWDKRNMDEIYSKELHEIVFEYIKAGYNLLHKKHMIKYSSGKYKRTLKIPKSQNYREKIINLKKVEDMFGELLGQEDDNYETQERTAIFLDSCSKAELKHLTKKFGEDKLGLYAKLN